MDVVVMVFSVWMPSARMLFSAANLPLDRSARERKTAQAEILPSLIGSARGEAQGQKKRNSIFPEAFLDCPAGSMGILGCGFYHS